MADTTASSNTAIPFSKNDHIIAALDVTGAGKSTFISKDTGCQSIQTSESVHLCTQQISMTPKTIKGVSVILTNTPGFDDTDRSDSDILQDVADFMAQTFEQGILLSGLIVLHWVLATRGQGSEVQRTRIFEKIFNMNADDRDHALYGSPLPPEPPSLRSHLSNN